MDMQEKITARREQIDSLQGKIQHLEETVEKLYQVKSLMYQWLLRSIMLNLDLMHFVTIVWKLTSETSFFWTPYIKSAIHLM